MNIRVIKWTMLFLWCTAPAFAQNPPMTPQNLQVWIDRLSDPSAEVRDDAVRQLYAAGPQAMAALKQLNPGDDYEASLRAQKILEKISTLYWVGAKVELSADHTTIHWDEPVTLSVKMTNLSEFPIQLPFLLQNRSQLDADPTAVQFGNMLDLADYLHVAAPNGDEIPLAYDDYRGCDSLEKSVNIRAVHEPAAVLSAGQTFVLNLSEFNRGAARFRLLEKGDYKIRFVYQPEWDDEQLRKNQVGLVTGNEITLTVTEPASEVIRNAQRELQADLHLEKSELVVTLRCTHDRPVGVNLNFGGSATAGFAQLIWVLHSGSQTWETDHVWNEIMPWQPDRIRTLKPTETVEVLRASLSDILQFKPLAEHIPPGAPFSLAVRYNNFLSRTTPPNPPPAPAQTDSDSQPNRDRTRDWARAFPWSIFTGSCTSTSLEINPAEK